MESDVKNGSVDVDGQMTVVHEDGKSTLVELVVDEWPRSLEDDERTAPQTPLARRSAHVRVVSDKTSDSFPDE